MDLPKLVARDRELRSEVRTLESDMQTLVYENYNKFISATDTIRDMASSVLSHSRQIVLLGTHHSPGLPFNRQLDGMEGEMDLLTTNMTSISTVSSIIDSSLSSRRERIAKLIDSHTLLKKLQFLFEVCFFLFA